MEELKILILEDDISTGMHLKSMLTRKGYHIVGVAYNGKECLELAKKENPEILIADINLGEGPNGLEIAEQIFLDYDVLTIFITGIADTEYAKIAKKKLNAISFLEKPVNDTDIINSIESAIIELERKQDEEALKNKIKQFEDRIFLKKDLVYYKILLEDILWLEANGAYCTIYTKTNEFKYSINLTRLSEKIGYEKLLRVHNKYTVNTFNVDRIENDKIHIGDKSFSIGKKYSKQVKEQFKRI